MKRRNGFVSNSSSSSFFIGYGIIKDRQKLSRELMNAGYSLDDYEIKIYEVGEFDKAIEDNNWDSTWRPEDNDPTDRLIIHAGNDITLECKENIYDKEFFVVTVNNDEGDGQFAVYDMHGEFIDLVYSSVTEDYFGEQQRALINIFKDDTILEKAEYKVGAERNG